MYILQEKDKNQDMWFDISKSNDYDFILELYNICYEKNKNKVYRVIEVFIYV